MLNELYVRFDDLATKHDIYKVETVGDCYMAAAGLFDDTPDHARKMLLFATEMQAAARQVVRPDGQPVVLRIGVHSGRVMSGVIGKIRQRFCLFGDTVNTASRMESAGVGGMIHVSEATHAQLAGCCPEFSWYCRGPIPIKGKCQPASRDAPPPSLPRRLPPVFFSWCRPLLRCLSFSFRG